MAGAGPVLNARLIIRRGEHFVGIVGIKGNGDEKANYYNLDVAGFRMCGKATYS